MDKTMMFNIEELENYTITETLYNVKKALDEKGYNGINQIVGYLLSGDNTYISNYKNCREKIVQINRDKILEALLKNYLKDVDEIFGAWFRN